MLTPKEFEVLSEFYERPIHTPDNPDKIYDQLFELGYLRRSGSPVVEYSLSPLGLHAYRLYLHTSKKERRTDAFSVIAAIASVIGAIAGIIGLLP